MVAEIFVPGAVVIFLGLAALVVGLGRWVGLIHGWMASFTVWFILSLLIIIILQRLAKKLIPGEENAYPLLDEDIDAFGSIALVSKKIVPGTSKGRIRIRDSTWPATTVDEIIPKGKKVKLIYRENLTWMVEPVDEIDRGDDKFTSP